MHCLEKYLWKIDGNKNFVKKGSIRDGEKQSKVREWKKLCVQVREFKL